MTTNSEQIEKYTSEQFLELWQSLNHNQKRFCVAMLECSTKKEGADVIGITSQTVYKWPDAVDKVIDYLLADVTGGATGILRSKAIKAAMIKVGGLDASDESVRLDTASEVLDRVIGRPTNKTEISGRDGETLVVTHKFDSTLDKVYGE